ncbi:hypothetical protein Rsub_00470 [Raphidocelis subcapitata]|uniref:Uncharacterized protein n=1 Tax=Raphidocelis subcapitata TaxID=307507 RepID=A0A2V0NL27_9CHLO|nr:hypothetical protein Rsub_00470 [Raphidocelis subcapitata]|eukprot:GBF87759.1 hypothetical protein Rsub_00470 [Raphidocelis subcapitata]
MDSLFASFDAGDAALVSNEAREHQLEEELATVREEVATLKSQIAAKDKEHKEQEERWAAVRAASPDKDAALAHLEATVRSLEAALAERSEHLEEALKLQSHYKQRAKDALAAATERAEDGAAAAANSATAATAAAEEEAERLGAELAAARARAAVEAEKARRALDEAGALVAAADEQRERAVSEALQAAERRWQERLEETQRKAGEQVAALQAEVVRLRATAESSLRASPDSVPTELSLLQKAKVQAQKETEAVRDMAAAAAAQSREEISRLISENANLKARIASDAAAAAQRLGRWGVAGKTFGALDGAGGAFERAVAGLERRRRGLAPMLAVGSVLALLLAFATIRSAVSHGSISEDCIAGVGRGCTRTPR